MYGKNMMLLSIVLLLLFIGSAEARELKTLLIVPSINTNSEFYLHAINPLDGLGYNYDAIDDSSIMSANLSKYSQIVIVGHSMELLEIDSNEANKIINAFNQGTDLLWIGNGIWLLPNLADNFGIRYVSHQPASSHNIVAVEWTDLSDSVVQSSIYSEYIVETSLAGASAGGYFVESGGAKNHPAITNFKKTSGSTATYIAFDVFSYWKTAIDNMTWDRPEMFIKYLRKSATKGSVTLHPYPGAKSGVFSVRFEDITPAGTMMEQNTPEWVERFNRTVNYIANKGIPSNIALVSVYLHPFRNETHYWNETAWNGNLKSVVERAVSLGGSIIAHGYTHQNGNRRDDYSGDDNEMYDEDTNLWLTLVQQTAKTIAAKAEILRQFGLNVKTWETPHYLSNADTYQAAKTANFSYVSESDTKIYPNYHGYNNMLGGTLLMIPETAGYIPDDDTGDFLEQHLNGILPRMERINGNFFIFYHNNVEFHYNSLIKIVDEAARRNFWFPNIEEYGQYTENLKKVRLNATDEGNKITVKLEYPGTFKNLTLKFRLPEKNLLVLS